MADLDWMYQPFAHRGLHNAQDKIIENSGSAIAAAIDNGYAVEVDLQPDRKNEPVVFHDSMLDRLTEETGPVNERELNALRKIRYTGSKDCIIGLDDLIKMIDGRVPLIIEIKSQWVPNNQLIDSIIRILTPYEGKFALMSFDPKLMLHVRKIAPEIPNGLVAGRFNNQTHWRQLTGVQRFLLRHLFWSLRLRSDFVAYNINGLPAMAPLMFRNLCRRPLLTWTVKDSDQCRKAEKWADAIIFENLSPP